jgi:hypothetical protein
MNLSKCFKTIAVVLGMTMSVALVSCGDDEPGNTDNTNNNSNNNSGSSSDNNSGSTTVANYNVFGHYNINLSQAFYDFYDITVSFTDADGQLFTTPFTENYEWSTAAVSYDNAPKEYYLVVTATPKANHPAIDETATYYMDATCSLNLYKYTDAEKNDNLSPYRTLSYTMASPFSVPGDKLADYLTKTRTFINKSINLDSGEITNHKED